MGPVDLGDRLSRHGRCPPGVEPAGGGVVDSGDRRSGIRSPRHSDPGRSPPRLGYLSEPRSSHRLREYMQHTAQFNITGQPAISLPLHWSEDGLPVGVQLVAAPWREDVLIRVASQLESATPWADRVPVVHA
ncbi:MAG: amidase family protein [Ilumatobacteraceae bacterium]